MIKKLIKAYYESRKLQCDINAQLEKLAELTESLPDWKQRWAGNGDRIVDIDLGETGRGRCMAYGLHKEDAFAVALCVQDPDTFFDCHAHHVSEFVLCLSGMIRICFDNNEHVELYPGMSFSIPPGVNHSAYFSNETKTLAVVMPATPGFPEGGRFSHPDNKPSA